MYDLSQHQPFTFFQQQQQLNSCKPLNKGFNDIAKKVTTTVFCQRRVICLSSEEAYSNEYHVLRSQNLCKQAHHYSANNFKRMSVFYSFFMTNHIQNSRSDLVSSLFLARFLQSFLVTTKYFLCFISPTLDTKANKSRPASQYAIIFKEYLLSS